MEPSEVVPPRPLTRWGSTWRYALAILFGAGAWISTLLDQHAGKLTAFLVIDLLLGCISLVLMHWRRRHPLPVALAVNVLGAFSSASSGAVAIVTVSLATRRRWREILPVGLLVILSSMFYFEIQPGSESFTVTLVFAVVFICAIAASGMYIGARRDLVATLHERAERAERDQTLRLSEARATERTRIAREMHDVLAHRLSLVAMHAGALSYRRGLSEDEVARSADIIRSNAHQALADLREVLGVLRTAEQDEAPDRPQPTLADLPSLVEEAMGAGTNVRLHNDIGDLAQAPETIGRSAYRMIQESLTNARKHAPDTTVDVVLSGRPGKDLVVEVRNPIRVGAGVSTTPGAGLGLIGLTERAELIGGVLEHGMSDGEFVVRARLPWPA